MWDMSPVLTSVLLKQGLPGRNGGPLRQGVKQGLHVGMGEPKSRWASPKVQRTVSGSREGRSRMKMRQGSKMREEVSIVALNRD